MGTDQEVEDQRGNLLRAKKETGVWKTLMKKWHGRREDKKRKSNKKNGLLTG